MQASDPCRDSGPPERVLSRSRSRRTPSGGQCTHRLQCRHRSRLSKISKKVYGSSRYWNEIYKANKKLMDSPAELKIGQTLIIPALDNE